MKTKIIFLCFIVSLAFKLSYSQNGWTPQILNPNNQLHCITFSSPDTGYIASWVGVIYKTTNAGNNWNSFQSSFNTGFQHIFFISNNVGWVVGGYGAIMHTTNGGQNWYIQNGNTSSLLLVTFFNDSLKGWIVGNNGTLLKTTNGGQTWLTQVLGTSYSLVSIYFLNQLTGIISSEQGLIWKTTDGGNTWFVINTGINSSLGRGYFINENTGWLTGTGGVIIKTTNSGNTWIQQISNTTNWLVTVFFPSPNTGWVAGTYGTILKTTNGGTNWFAQNSNTTTDFRSNYFFNDLTGFTVGFNGVLDKTTNGGMMIPSAPTLVSPANNSTNNTTTPTLVWNSSAGADRYFVLISSVPNMSYPIDTATVTATQYTVPPEKLLNAHTYYWCVNASNSIGSSSFSSIWNFGTNAVPPAPVLVSPANGSIGLPLTPNLVWNSASGAVNYKVQISTISNFGVISDSATVSGTNYLVPSGRLTDMTTYFWRVNAGNSNGQGTWSTVWSFTVMTTGIKLYSTEIPDKFRLFNNYPNPFNPSTKIKFDVPSIGQRQAFDVQLFVYDALGREVDVILNSELKSGKYEVTWNAEKLPSGMYFLLMRTQDILFTQKMLLVK